jgi:hypothetical protein
MPAVPDKPSIACAVYFGFVRKGDRNMNKRMTQLFWYKTSTGRYVAKDSRARLDDSTVALVRDLLKEDRELEPARPPAQRSDPTIPLGIAESPLPFEAVHQWVTWAIRGNNHSH